MDGVTLHQIECFDAVAVEGGVQAAADRLGRTYPAVASALRNLEAQLDLALFDRSGYRIGLTEAGRSFHERARSVLSEMAGLKTYASQLAMGEESALTVVVGDLCPLAETLDLLRGFFATCPATRLDLVFEAISGPWERLFDGDANLILHHIDKADPRLEFIDLGEVRLVPVAAPGFVEEGAEITPDGLRGYVQSVIRDTARRSEPRGYYILDGARQLTVSDQLMKREVIRNGMGWGHMPLFLVEQDLENGRLVSLANASLPGGRIELVAARRRDRPHGPVATRLWTHLAGQAPGWASGWS